MNENLTKFMEQLVQQNVVIDRHRPQATLKGRLCDYPHPDLSTSAVDRLRAMIHVSDGNDAAQAQPEMIICHVGMELPTRKELTQIEATGIFAREKWPLLFE